VPCFRENENQAITFGCGMLSASGNRWQSLWSAKTPSDLELIDSCVLLAWFRATGEQNLGLLNMPLLLLDTRSALLAENLFQRKQLALLGKRTR
jgi:hypothetical protein